MKKIILLIMAFTVLMLAGCSQPQPVATVSAEGEVTSAVVPTVSVTGEGKLTLTPDMATMTFSVEQTDESAEAASQKSAKVMEDIRKALSAFGIVEKDITTQDVSLYETWEYNEKTREDKMVYCSYNSISVKVRNIEQAGKVIDTAVKAGANRNYGISFGLSDPEAKETELLKLAVEDAKKRASAIAEASGMTLGDPVTISDGTVWGGEEIIYDNAAERPQAEEAPAEDEAEDSVSTIVTPGEMVLTARVECRYRLT